MVDIINIPDGDTDWGTKMRTNITRLSASIDALNGAYILPNGGVPEADLAPAVRTKLNTANAVTSVAGRTGAVTVTKADVGLSSVDNTADSAKPVSTAQGTAIGARAPQNLSGTYAARPAATSVLAGTVYYATNTVETYRSNGTVWSVVTSAGNELGYAEVTANFTTGTTTNAMQDVTGLTITITVPERPFMLKIGCLTRYTATDADALLRITDVTDGSDVLEVHGTRNATSTTYTQIYGERRISGLVPGTTRVYKVAVMQRAAAYLIAASSTFPATLQAVSI